MVTRKHKSVSVSIEKSQVPFAVSCRVTSYQMNIRIRIITIIATSNCGLRCSTQVEGNRSRRIIFNLLVNRTGLIRETRYARWSDRADLALWALWAGCPSKACCTLWASGSYCAIFSISSIGSGCPLGTCCTGGSSLTLNTLRSYSAGCSCSTIGSIRSIGSG